MSQKSNEDLAFAWVSRAYVAKNKKFPSMLREVDDVILGSIAKSFKVANRINTKDMLEYATVLKRSLITGLENGNRTWTEEFLLEYIHCIKEAVKRRMRHEDSDRYKPLTDRRLAI